MIGTCNNCCYPDSYSKRNNIYGSESSISTNRDSIYNKYSIRSNNRTISHYSNFGNYKREENNLYSFLNKYEEKKDNQKDIPLSNKNNIIKSKKLLNAKNNFNHKYISQFNNNKKVEEEKNKCTKNIIYPFKYNNYFNNENNFSIRNKTLNILNLNDKENNNNEEVKLKRCASNYLSKNNKKIWMKNKNKSELFKRKYITEKNKNNKLNKKKIILESNISKNIKINNLKEDNLNFDLNKKKLELIKQQYKENTFNTQTIIHEVKYNFNKINYYNNEIIDLNNKSPKYSDLIGPNKLSKYREENIKNLKKYKPKSKQNYKNNVKRPLSYNKTTKKEKKIKTLNKRKEKVLNTEKTKRNKTKGKNEEITNNRVLTVLKNDSENNNIKNCLDYYNYLLWNNEKKKQLFNKELEKKSNLKKCNSNKNSHSYTYKYENNMDRYYNNTSKNNNIDKNLHLKYIYHPGSEMNQNLYYQKLNDNSCKNYYINSYSYKRKNKYLLNI